MPCLRKSKISSALTAATATLSAISSSTVAPLASTGVESLATSSAVPIFSSATASSVVSSASATAMAASTIGNTTYAGVNIAGFDFGCGTDGTCTVDGITDPTTGPAQMQHFFDADNLNVFRLPVGWQYLTNSNVGGDLDPTNFAKYDSLVQSCLDTGARCIVDIHNYARWDGEIIGQGGPSDADFAALWTSLATQYANDINVFFGLMNEPHDVTVSTWADTVQAAVTAIRAVAPVHTLLLPGSSYASAGTLPTEAGPYLLNVTNPDGSTDNLVFDVHKYLDSDNSGTNAECVTDNVDEAFAPLATWLRSNGRQALVSETGGGNTASCQKFLCQEVAYLNDNSDVYLGYVGWAAGGFDSTYALGLTPSGTTAAEMVDTSLMTSCIAR